MSASGRLGPFVAPFGNDRYWRRADLRHEADNFRFGSMRVDRDRLKRAGCGSARDQPWKGPQSAHKRAKRFEAACAKAVPSAADPRYWRARYIFILAAMSS